MAQVEPVSLEEALQADNANYWIQAINDEINALEENKTWELVCRDKDMHVISNRWVFRKKYKSNGDVEKYKARLVAKGYSQIPGIDYEETFAPVVKFDSIRTLLAISAAKNLKLYQFDVKTAFLHGNIEETIYMEQPYGFAKDNRVCKLNRSLYGLKQAPRQWNKRIAEFLETYGLAQSRTDPCVFYKTTDAEGRMYLALYVDDGLLCGNNVDGINKLLCDMSKEFKLTYGVAECFVGLQIEMNRNKNRLIIHQGGYALKILKKFNHSECQEVSTPVEPGTKFVQGDDGICNLRTFPYREAIGSLMYLMIATRPDLAFVVSVLSRYMEKPQQQHWNGVKRVLKYVKGTIPYGISFIIDSNNTEMEAYCDADWAGDLDSRRSTSGWLCLLNGGPISWCSKKQGITATSTTEAEFIAMCGATKQIVWLRRLLSDFNCKQYHPTRLKCDNQRAITITKNPGSMKGTKHLKVQYYYTCDQQKAGEIAVEYVDSSRQLADPLTKPLPRNKFVGLRTLYGVNAFEM